MYGKFILLIMVVGILMWLWFEWPLVDQATTNSSKNMPAASVIASSTPPVTYVASSTATEVTLDIQTGGSVATLRGLGYANLTLKATTSDSDVVYANTNELVQVILQNDQLRVLVAGMELFLGTKASSQVIE